LVNDSPNAEISFSRDGGVSQIRRDVPIKTVFLGHEFREVRLKSSATIWLGPSSQLTANHILVAAFDKIMAAKLTSL